MQTVFRTSQGFFQLSEHAIPLLNSFVPKRLPSYKILVKLRDEVQKQLNDLEKQDLIRKSNSPMASPVVCVLKRKDGKRGVRLAVDYRYVNRHTIADALPTPRCCRHCAKNR